MRREQSPSHNARGRRENIHSLGGDVLEQDHVSVSMKPNVGSHNKTLARVAHDLSQPLSAIVAATRVLRSSGDHVTHDKASAVIEHQTSYMQSLLNDLLDDVRQRSACMLD